MGVRSDVGVALKKNVLDAMNDTQKREWLGDCDCKYEHEEGTLFFFENRKWYIDHDPTLEEMYSWLRTQDLHDVCIVEACHDYPESDQGDLGWWNENPWNLYRVIRVSLNIESN